MAKWEKTDIPLNGGLNLSMDPQAPVPGDFVQLDNADFENGATLSARSGHVGLQVSDATYGTMAPESASAWVYGAGLYDPSNPYEPSSSYSSVGPLRGVAARDNDLVAWDGWRTLSYSNGSWYRHGPEEDEANGISPVEPTLVCHGTENSILSVSSSVTTPDVAKGLLYTLYTWKEGSSLYATVEDNQTKAHIFRRKLLYTSPSLQRVVYSRNDGAFGGHFFVVVTSSTFIRVLVISETSLENSFNNIGTYAEISASSVDPQPFDVRPLVGGKCAVCFEQSGNLRYVVVNSAKESVVGLNLVTGGIQTQSPVGLAIHPDGGILAVYNNTTPNIIANFFSPSGAAISNTTVASGTNISRFTCEFHYLKEAAEDYKAAVGYYNSSLLRSSFVTLYRAGALSSATTLGDSVLTHQACRAGNIVYFTTGYIKANTVQPMLVTMAADRTDTQDQPRMYPVAAMLRNEATIASSGKMVQSISFVPTLDENFPSTVNSTNWCYAAIGSRVVLTPSGTTRKDYHLKRIDLDFLPKFRTAQGGRSLYIAGGVVQEFDGERVCPAGFLLFPEFTVASSATAGSLGTNSTYTYRVYCEERNANGEWVRSASLTKSVSTGANTSVDITLPAMPYIYRDKWRWSIYRGAANSTLLKLVRQDTPTFPFNYKFSSTTINDGASDASIASNALDPSPSTTQSGFGLLDQMPPPPCTIIASGNQRVWFAGGAIENGRVAYSRLYDPGEVALWNEALNVQVDRTDKPVTGLGFLQDTLVVFKDDRAFFVVGQGPDNLGAGDFADPVPVLTDIGCVSADAVGTTPIGVAFQSKLGPRVISPSGGLLNIGEKIDPGFSEDVPRLVTTGGASVRFHGPSDTYVLNYHSPENLRWSKWTYGAQAVCKWTSSSAGTTNVIVPLPYIKSEVWYEDSSAVTDGGAEIRLAMDLAWLKTGPSAGWGRVKWWGLVGKYLSTHKMHVTTKYNYRDTAVDDHVWTPGGSSIAGTTHVNSTPLDIRSSDYGDLSFNHAFITSTTNTPWYPGGPYVVCKSFKRQRCGAFRLFFEAVRVETDDDAALGIASSGSGMSISSLTVAYQPDTENGRARWGARSWAKN